MAESQSAIDLDIFQSYDVPALKQYLKARNILVVGRKYVLIARAFAAHEANIPISLTQCQSDPMFDLVEGWLNKETAWKEKLATMFH